MATLSRQATDPTDTGHYWSLQRDNDLRTQLEAADTATFGSGVVSGGVVTGVSGFTVKVPTGTVLRSEGVTYTLAADQNFTVSGALSTLWVWGLITRTAASTGAPTASDTYALVISQTTTSTPPTAQSILLAVVTTGASAVSGINNAPAGKFLRVTRKLATSKLRILPTESANIPADEQMVVSSLIIDGELVIDGVLVVTG